MPGLTTAQANEKIKTFGLNKIYKETPISFFSIAKHEVTEPMIIFLLVIGIIYSIWGKLEDALTIFIVIILLVLAEVYTEFRAKKAIDSLAKIAAPKTKVVRDNILIEIDSELIVPGDVLILTSGTKIAADAKITHAINLQIDESPLTGESFPVSKKKDNYIFAGTTITSGEGQAVVTTTGVNTKFGKIAALQKNVKAPKTALQQLMKSLSGKLVYVAIFFSVLIPFIGILRGQSFKVMVLTGLSLAFATIPEELPIIITMVLGIGSYTLSKNKFLVKKIKAAETLGNATVIMTDKTGTLTTGKLKIVSLYPQNKTNDILINSLGALSEYSLNPLEKNILEKSKELKLNNNSQIIQERNFTSEQKTKSILRKQNDDHFKLYLSGAPEEVFKKCKNIDEEAIHQLTSETAKGRRVIAIASKNLTSNEIKEKIENLENSLNFIGLLSFEDSEREGVKETITKAKNAGIRTIMVTGDHPLTAKYIANRVGIDSQQILTGEALDKINDEQLQTAVKTVSIFARTNPEHKYRLLKALQKNGEVVAVTGDGINDALALKGADIGIAMGIKGTDVAKEAAEVVLADDNYNTIAQGVFEGRKFFDNLNKGVKYYLSVKIGLVMIFLLPVILGIPMPFAPIQIIVLELFMDLAASAGFVAEPAEKDIYNRKPRNSKEDILNNKFLTDVLIKGFALFLGVTTVYMIARHFNLSFVDTQTLAFTAWIFGHITLAVISRSDKESIFSLGFFSNKIINIWAVSAIGFLIVAVYLPFFHQALNLTNVAILQFLLAAITSIIIISLLGIRKIYARKSS